MTKIKKRLIIIALLILGFDKLLSLVLLVLMPIIIVGFITLAIGTATRLVIIPDNLWASIWRFQKLILVNLVSTFKKIWN
jgi:hypothetical protein